MPKNILVIGSGLTATAIVQALRCLPAVRCVLGSRDPVQGVARARDLDVEFTPIDITRASTLHGALQDVFAVVHTAGPFLWQDRAVAAACARRGVHYLDLADTPAFVCGMEELDQRARDSGACLLSGAGVAPALSGALALELAGHFDRLDALEVGLYVQGPRSSGAWRTLLTTVGAELLHPAANPSRAGAPAGRIQFAPPQGATEAFAWDSPDVRLFPERFHVAHVRSRQASDPACTRLIRWSAWARSRGLLKAPERQLLGVARRLGARMPARTILGVEAQGPVGAQIERRRLELATDRDVATLATAPVVTLVRRWSEGPVDAPGARTALGAVVLTEIAETLAGQGVRLSSGPIPCA